MRACGQAAYCPSHASSGQDKTEAFLLLIMCSSFRHLMKNYSVLSSHVVIRQRGRWKRRPTKQPYRAGLHFLSIIHGVRITLLITKISTLHGVVGFFFWPARPVTRRAKASPGSLCGDLHNISTTVLHPAPHSPVTVLCLQPNDTK